MPSARFLAPLAVVFFAATAPAADRVAPGPYRIDPASVQRCGPAYRYPQDGWVVLHIEGTPYERGRQHGKLLWPEIADFIDTLASHQSPKAPADGWGAMRTLVNALFLRRYDRELLEEMQGIADGAAAAGAKFDGRALDLLDLVTLNSWIEADFVDSNLEATAHGLEGVRFPEPPFARPKRMPTPHCSAFAATGPATADGKVVFGHITMWNLHPSRHFNVWLDLKPARGRRVLMQTYPGGVMSGMDYYQNDAGLLVAETTIKQTKFDPQGESVVSRIRRAVQYGTSIDEAVAILGKDSNGVYTNEWLLADTKTNEIAMYELGTRKSRLWRSSKDEWVGGTKGFYWGCNNARDIQVRMEAVASVEGKPVNLVFVPSDRDRAWLRLYEKHKGKIDASFGFEAFTSVPLAAFPSLDAKFTTSTLAKELKSYALFGPPVGRTRHPTEAQKARFHDIRPLVGNDWTLLAADPPGLPKDEGGLAGDVRGKAASWAAYKARDAGTLPPAWRGSILPKADADVWLAAAFADYEKVVALENALKDRGNGALSAADKEQLALALFEPRCRWRTAVRRLGRDVSLAETHAEVGANDWYLAASGKGVLLLHALRREMGAETFDKMMDDFGRANAGKEVTTQEFREHAEMAAGRPLAACFDPWLTGKGPADAESGPCWSLFSFEAEPEKALIVYGTRKEREPQREAAEHLREKLLRRWNNFPVPIKADVDVTDDDMKTHHLLVIGRPDSNAVAARLAGSLPVTFGLHSFEVRGKTYAHPASAVVAAGGNPADPRYSAVVYAGLSAEATWRCVQRLPEEGSAAAALCAEVLLMPAGEQPEPLAVTAPAAGKAAAAGAASGGNGARR
jgi:hypothetical protein